MSDNPFRAAIEHEPDDSRTIENYRPFDVNYDPSRGLSQNQRMAMHPNMSRQDLFEAGIIKVKDLDDEELREGRCRDRRGVIPRRGKRTGNIPADIYDEMVQEHLRRSNEKLRSQMDVALATLVDIMNDDTAEPKDRADAAKYLYERVAGKTPERVAVQINKQPWEEVMGGIAQLSRADSKRLREGVIDAETVDLGMEVPQGAESTEPETSQPAPDGNRGAPTAPIQGMGQGVTDVSEVPLGGPPRSETSMGDQRVPGEQEADIYRPSPVEQLGIKDVALFGDPRIPTPTKVPDYQAPEMSSATAPSVDNLGQTTSERLREEAMAAADLAERRKEARAKRQLAKKRRIAKRAMGVDAKSDTNIEMHDDGDRLRFTVD